MVPLIFMATLSDNPTVSFSGAVAGHFTRLMAAQLFLAYLPSMGRDAAEYLAESGFALDGGMPEFAGAVDA